MHPFRHGLECGMSRILSEKSLGAKVVRPLNKEKGWKRDVHISKKSPTGPTERTPKPEYLIALATYLGVRW